MFSLNTLILIDGYSLLFRDYYGCKEKLTNKKGLPVGGIYVFIQQLKWIIDNFTVINKLGYTHIGITFDTGKKTFRSQLYNEYKKNRAPVDKDLICQFPIARDVADVLNIQKLEIEGYEADDVIATYTKKAEKENFNVCIISSDKDLMQLISDNVFMYDAKKKVKIRRNDVKEKFGVYPEQMLDFLTLKGDAIDNVPGVEGIGDKTAEKLLNQFGNIDNMLKDISKIEPKKIKENIQKNISNIELSKKLVSLYEDVPLNISLEDLKKKKYDMKILEDFYRDQNFISLLNKQIQGTLF